MMEAIKLIHMMTMMMPWPWPHVEVLAGTVSSRLLAPSITYQMVHMCEQAGRPQA
jgi:hypothetical protein